MENTPIKYTGMALLFCFVGCVVNAEMLNKPTGEIALQSLLNAGDIVLSNEPLCNMSSASMDKPNLVLSDHLATILSTSFESKTQTILTSSCSESKHDLTESKVIEVWDCRIGINENNPAGEFITSSTVLFSLSIVDYSLIHNSLRCY